MGMSNVSDIAIPPVVDRPPHGPMPQATAGPMKRKKRLLQREDLIGGRNMKVCH
jgi:hypothetical protein